jgi:UDP-N-acetylmuramoyl-tripeptide--D-alanyl-D-alanine ligase
MSSHARVLEWPALIQDEARARCGRGGRGGGHGASQRRLLISNVATDSREIGEGGLFFAMRGEAMDGHRFCPAR